MRTKPGAEAAGDSPLAAMAARRKASDAPETIEVDLSDWYGAGSSVTLRRLTVAEKWMASRERTKAIKASRPLWPDELCTIVSTLATAHVAPDPGKAGPIPFYRDLADDTDDAVLWHIQERYLSLAAPSPGLSASEADKVLLYCCLTYLHRHPSELDNLDATALDDLLATYKRDLEEKAALVKALGPLAALVGLGGGK